jgi:hypothetical protein
MKSIFCKIFGHTIDDNRYGKFYGGTVDGMGHIHDIYIWECCRCKQNLFLYVHRQKEKKEKDIEMMIEAMTCIKDGTMFMNKLYSADIAKKVLEVI